jgi:hypothetical protein
MWIQLAGLVLLLAGVTWLLGPWVLVTAGVLLLVVPELVDGRGRGARADEEARR